MSFENSTNIDLIKFIFLEKITDDDIEIFFKLYETKKEIKQLLNLINTLMTTIISNNVNNITKFKNNILIHNILIQILNNINVNKYSSKYAITGKKNVNPNFKKMFDTVKKYIKDVLKIFVEKTFLKTTYPFVELPPSIFEETNNVNNDTQTSYEKTNQNDETTDQTQTNYTQTENKTEKKVSTETYNDTGSNNLAEDLKNVKLDTTTTPPNEEPNEEPNKKPNEKSLRDNLLDQIKNPKKKLKSVEEKTTTEEATTTEATTTEEATPTELGDLLFKAMKNRRGVIEVPRIEQLQTELDGLNNYLIVLNEELNNESNELKKIEINENIKKTKTKIGKIITAIEDDKLRETTNDW